MDKAGLLLVSQEVSWCWALVTALSGSCSLLRTSPRGVTTACITPAKGDGPAPYKSIPRSCSRALLMLSQWEPVAAMRQPPHIAPLPTVLGRALKKSWCFTCCHYRTHLTAPSRQHQTELCMSGHIHRVQWCSSSQGDRRTAHPRELAPAQGWGALQGSSTPGRREGLSMSTEQEQGPLWAVLGAVLGMNR